MAFAQGSRSSLAYIAESTFGTTPSTPTLANLPINSHSLDLTKDRVEGNEIQADRMPRVDRHGNRQAGGSIEVDLRKGDFDALLESAFLSSFSTNVLKIGTTPKFFSMEDRAVDVNQYRLFKGMSVSTLSVSIAPNQMVTGTFEMVGKDMVQSGTSATASPITAASSNAPFDSYSGVISDGGTGIAIVTSLEFSLSNSFAPTFIVGSSSTPQLEYGRAIVEGTMTVYYENATLINKFLNETESSIQVTVDDPTGSSDYTFLFPRVKYNGASVPLANPQSRLITLPFVSLFDSTEGTNLKLTRSA
ncbi:MAG: phage tail tube protein [Fluviibacter sp.]